jgi:hypothetical protein
VTGSLRTGPAGATHPSGMLWSVTPADRAAHRGSWGSAIDRLGPVVATFCVLVVLAAGGSAVALLLAPGSTDRYFSWTLRPEGAAAMIGAMYLASAAIFAWALTLPWPQVRSLFVGVLALTTPTFVLTVIHNEVFDFGRWQAVAWVVLFLFAPVMVTAILATRPAAPAGGPRLRDVTRLLLALLAAAFAVLAVSIWFDALRDDVADASPVDLLRLTGTYLGAWASFLAVLLGLAVVGGRWDHARLPLLMTAAAGVGAAVAFVRTYDDLRRPLLAVVVALGLAGLAAAIYVLERPGSSRVLSSHSTGASGR